MSFYNIKNELNQLMYEYDASSFKANTTLALKGKLPETENKITFAILRELITKATRKLSVLGKLDSKTLLSMSTEEILDAGLECPVIGERDYIVKLAFLSQFLNNVESAVAEYVKHEKYSEYTKNSVLTGGVLPYVKKQIQDTKHNGADIPSTSVKYTACTGNINVLKEVAKDFDADRKLMTSTSMQFLSILKEADIVKENIAGMLGTAKEKNTENVDAIKNIRIVEYTVDRSVNEAVVYTASLIMKLLDLLYLDGVTINKFNTDLFNNISTKEISEVKEAVCTITNADPHAVSGDFVKGNISTFKELCDNIKGLHSTPVTVGNEVISISNFVAAKRFNNAEADYNITTYLDVAKALISISTGLDIIGKEGDEYMMIFKDVLVKSGLSLDLSIKYGNEIKAITDLSMYNTVNANEDVMQRIYAELAAFSDNMECLSNIAKDVYEKITGLKDRFVNNVNTEYNDTQTVQEIIIFLDDFKTAYTDMCVDICRNFMDRLNCIDEIIKSVDASSELVGSADGDVIKDTDDIIDTIATKISESTDYVEMMYKLMYEEAERKREAEFRFLEENYYKDRMRELRGVDIVFEADTSTTPTVVDNSVQQGSGDAGADKLKNFASNMGSNMSNFVKTLLDKFTDLLNRLKGSNTKWLQDNEQGITSRDYKGVSVKVLPYGNMDPNTLLQDINKLTNNVKSMTPQNIQNVQDKDDLYRKLFAFIPGGISENAEGGIVGQMAQYYKVNKAKLEVVEIKDDAVKTFVTGKVLPFAKTYNDNYSNQLKSALENLAKAVDDTVKTYGGADASTQNQNNNQTNNTQNNTQNKNTASNITEKATWMSTAVKSFTGNALNVSRDRYSDYMKILKALAPANTNQNNNNQQQNQQQENQ